MTLHACAECGLMHDHVGEASAPVIPEVEIARINADRDIQVARLSRATEADYNETRVEVAEIEAEAEVASAEVTAEVVGEIIAAEGQADVDAESGEPEPVIVVADDPGPEAPPPPAEGTSSGPPAKKSIWPMGG